MKTLLAVMAAIPLFFVQVPSTNEAIARIPSEVLVEEPAMTIEEKIVQAATAAGIDPAKAVQIAKCESSLNPLAANATSTAKGLYQFTDTTWAWIGASGHQFDADENIKMFMVYYPKYPQWWVCK